MNEAKLEALEAAQSAYERAQAEARAANAKVSECLDRVTKARENLRAALHALDTINAANGAR